MGADAAADRLRGAVFLVGSLPSVLAIFAPFQHPRKAVHIPFKKNMAPKPVPPITRSYFFCVARESSSGI
jgi:hypothetical protein